MTMSKTISNKISVKASSDKTLVKHLTGNKTFGIEPSNRFYDIGDGDGTEEGEDAEIIVVYDSILMVSKQNLVMRKFSYIDTFDHEGIRIYQRDAQYTCQSV